MGEEKKRVMLQVYSGILLVSSSEEDLIHDVFSLYSSKTFDAEDGGTDDGPCSLEGWLRLFLFDVINGSIVGKSFESTLQLKIDSSKSSISHRTAATLEGKLHNTTNITRSHFTQ